MPQNTRNTKWAIVEETTEGTPVAPSATGDYVALQDGAFDLTFDFEQLQNEEIRASIGNAPNSLGFENISGSLSHYMTHSGTEATAPEFNILLESLMGTESIRSTERDTVNGSTAGDASTRATIVVDSGEGAEFARGEHLLIKDGTNGYSIRPVYSVSTDTLSLGFNLSTAPSSGVSLGRDVTYKPANSGHPSFTAWDYRADGGAIQAGAGCQCTSMSLEATAGEFINASFEFAGTKGFFNPLEVTSSNNKIPVTDDGGTFEAEVTAKLYRSPHDLADAMKTALDAAGSDTFTVTYSDTSGKFTITSDGTLLSLLWKSGGAGSDNDDDHIGTLIGFSDAADDTGAGGSTGYTSDIAITLSAPQTPNLDAQSPIVAKNNEVLLGTFAETSCVLEGVQSLTIDIATEKPLTPNVCAETGREGSVANARSATADLVLTLDQYDAGKFDKFINNTSISFQYIAGSKDGSGNWEAGKNFSVYMPDAKILTHNVSDADGIVTLELSLQAHLDSSGNGEIYVSFL